MRESYYPYLCGGTFFTLLLQFKPLDLSTREHIEGKESKFSEPKVLIGLGKVCDKSYPEPRESEKKSFKAKTSKYKNCDEKGSKRFPSLPSTYVENFKKRIKNISGYRASLEAMHNFTKTFINISLEDIYSQLVKLLLNLIELDKNIKDCDKFYVCPSGQPIKKSGLRSFYNGSSVVCLPAFLLGILHFIIVKEEDYTINNAFGRETIKTWNGNPVKIFGKEKPEYDIKVSIDIPPIPTDGEDNQQEQKPHDTDALLLQGEMQSEQMRDIFINTAERHKIMNIINRKPAIMGWNDSTCLNVFLRHIDKTIIRRYKKILGSTALYENIEIFMDALRIQALSIETTLNRRFDFEDEAASINMEGEDASAELKTKPNQIELPRLSFELFHAAFMASDDNSSDLSDDSADTVNAEPCDVMELVELAVTEWGNFRNEMNLIYKEICETIPE